MNTRIGSEVLRFLVAGTINTAATYALYLALLLLFPYALSYTIAYVLGIGIAYVLNSGFVFRSRRTWRGLALFPLVYLVQYLLGLIVLAILVRTIGISQQFAALGSIVITTPITFVLNRIVLKTPGSSMSSERN